MFETFESRKRAVIVGTGLLFLVRTFVAWVLWEATSRLYATDLGFFLLLISSLFTVMMVYKLVRAWRTIFAVQKVFDTLDN